MLICYRCFHRTVINTAKKSKNVKEEGPIPFSQSKAASWNSQLSFSPPAKDVPWYQPFSVLGSTTIFLVYFLFLREENEMDIELNQTLYERVPALEKNQLTGAIKYHKESGEDTSALEKR